jgi:hypothetical protein
MAHPNETVGVAIIATVALVSLLLTALAGAAWRRTGNRKLAFVAAALLVFFAKSVLTAYSVRTGFIGHEDLELIGSLGDLLVVLLLVAPFAAPLLRRGP